MLSLSLEPDPTTRHCLLSAVKNEGPDLLQWVCYHRAIGFSAILIYSNDCTDLSDTLLGALAALGWVTHIRQQPPPDQSAQGFAAKRALDRAEVQTADWVIWLDADEFLNIHRGAGHLADLVDVLSTAEGLALNWRLFGDSGHDTSDDSLVMARFTRASLPKQRQSRTVKTLFRMGPGIADLDIHRPLWSQGSAPLRVLDAAGAPLSQDFLLHPKPNGRPADMLEKGMQRYDIGQINHYAVKALDRVALKQRRGNGLIAGAPGGRFGFGYLRRFNHNDQTDTSIQRHLPAVRALIADALADPAVKAAYAACHLRFADLLSEVGDVAAALARDRTGKSAKADGEDER